MKQQNVVWEIEKDNQIKQRYNRAFVIYSEEESFIPPNCSIVYTLADSIPRTDQRDWIFQNEKAELKITGGNVGTDEYQILQLTAKALKLEDIHGNILIFNKK